MVGTFADTFRACSLWLKAWTRNYWFPTRQTIRDPRSMLLIATHLPPFDNGGVYRPLSWLRYANKNGWGVTAVSRKPGATWDHAGAYLAAQTPRATRLIHYTQSTLRPSWGWFPRIGDSFLDALQIFATVSAENMLAPAAIVATGPAFENFVAGYYLARMFGSKLILDYRDEWTLCPFDYVHLGNSDLYWEKRCLYAADGVVFATVPILQHTIGTLAPDQRGRAYVVRNGWEPSDFGSMTDVRSPAKNMGNLTLSFVGYLGHFHPLAPFLSDVAAAIKLRPELQYTLTLQFIGKKSAECSNELASFPYPSMLRLLPQIPKNDAVRAMCLSDALLILAGDNLARYLPGKLYEYIASKRPIIIHGAPGATSAIVEDLRVGCRVVPGDVVSLIEAIDSSRANKSGSTADNVSNWLEQHTREALAARFFRFADAVVRGDAQALRLTTALPQERMQNVTEELTFGS